MANVILGKQLKGLRNNKGFTQQQVADFLGLKNKSTLASWEGGKSEPDAATFLKLCKIYEVNDILKEFTGFSLDLKVGVDEMKHIKKYRALDKHGKEIIDWNLSHEYTRCTTPEPTPAHVLLPEVVEEERDPYYNVVHIRNSEQPVSAGTGVYLGPEAFKTILVKENDLTKRALFSVPVSGDSMEPLYQDRDVLIVERSEELEPGEIGIFTLNGEGCVKKLGHGQLISLNPEYPPIPMDESILLNGRVIGVLQPEWIVG